MSHFGYAVLFVGASALMAAVLQASNRAEFLRYLGSRFVTPLAALIGVSWVMYFLGNL